MTSITVWLLIITSEVYGKITQVQAPYFATSADCERVGSANPRPSYTHYRCVQATVFAAPPQPALPVSGGKK